MAVTEKLAALRNKSSEKVAVAKVLDYQNDVAFSNEKKYSPGWVDG